MYSKQDYTLTEEKSLHDRQIASLNNIQNIGIKQELLFAPQCFNSLPHNPELMAILKTWLEKEKMLVTRIFSFPTMFLTLLNTNLNFWVTFILLSANDFNLYQSKILLFGKELNFCLLQGCKSHI